jgi:hypothetical protein
VRKGDRVVVKLKTGKLLVREVTKKAATKLDVTTLAANKNEALATKDIAWLAKVVWVSQ